MKIYRPKGLIDGQAIGQESGSSWVAVPDKFAKTAFRVEYAGASIEVKDWKAEAVMFRRFRDKFWQLGNGRRQFYTLGYFAFTQVAPPKLFDVKAAPMEKERYYND